jgi:hypothetical protein
VNVALRSSPVPSSDDVVSTEAPTRNRSGGLLVALSLSMTIVILPSSASRYNVPGPSRSEPAPVSASAVVVPVVSTGSNEDRLGSADPPESIEPPAPSGSSGSSDPFDREPSEPASSSPGELAEVVGDLRSGPFLLQVDLGHGTERHRTDGLWSRCDGDVTPSERPAGARRTRGDLPEREAAYSLAAIITSSTYSSSIL